MSKTVLITGGTGSFGHKFTELMLREHRPKKLIVYSRDEWKQHEECAPDQLALSRDGCTQSVHDGDDHEKQMKYCSYCQDPEDLLAHVLPEPQASAARRLFISA